MAKQEIVKRTVNILRILQWRYWLRTEIIVDWPNGWTPQDHLGNSALSSDPNEWYREWLERNVGRQGWTWDWRVTMLHPEVRDMLVIKFRRERDAILFTLKHR